MKLFVPTVRTIWIVDDDPDDQAILKDEIKTLYPSVHLTTLSDGEGLLKALSTLPAPDLIFLDIHMPCKNGQQCLQEIRSDARFKSLPIIVYSSSPRPFDITYSYELGATLYVKKPSSYVGIQTTLQKVLQMDWTDVKEITNKQFVGGKYVPFEAL